MIKNSNTRSVERCADGVFRNTYQYEILDLPYPSKGGVKTGDFYESPFGITYPVWRTRNGKLAVVKRAGYILYLRTTIETPVEETQRVEVIGGKVLTMEDLDAMNAAEIKSRKSKPLT